MNPVASSALKNQLLRWAVSADGNRDRASLFMAGVAAYGPKFAASNRSLPGDFDEFWRCVLLVRSCASFGQAFPRLRQVSPEWAAFVDRWDDFLAIAYPMKHTGVWSKHSEKHLQYGALVAEIRAAVQSTTDHNATLP